MKKNVGEFIVGIFIFYFLGTSNLAAQAPNISYPSGSKTYLLGSSIPLLRPINTGGSVTNNGQVWVSLLAGSRKSLHQGDVNGVGENALFNSPTGIAVDATGNVFVVDNGNRKIKKISPNGVVTTFAGSGQAGILDGNDTLANFNDPIGIAIGPSGDLYVTENINRLIRKISPSGIVSTLKDSLGNDFSNGNFYIQKWISIDNSGNILLTAASRQICKVDPKGKPTFLISQFNQGYRNGYKDTALTYYPRGITSDLSGNVIFTDGSSVIRKISPTYYVSPIAGKYNPINCSTDGLDSLACFNGTYGLAVDAIGNIFVADGGNNKIRKIGIDGVVSTLAGSGVSGVFYDAIGTSASFAGPYSLAVDTGGNIYFTDASNSIKKISPSNYAITPSLPAGLYFNIVNGVISGVPTVASPPTNYTVTASNSYGVSSWTINISVLNPLPVELINFSVKSNIEGNPILTWQTANELNTTNFIIESSIDGINFTTVNTVAAKDIGNNSYIYTDLHPGR